MITLYSSTCYTQEDYRYLFEAIESGMILADCGAPDCQSCGHRVACSDLMRFHRFVGKRVDSGADHRGKRQAD